MDRRDFIRHGALGASGAVAGGHVPRDGLSPAPKRPPLAPHDMIAHLAKVDRGVERISQWPLSESFPGLAGDVQQESLGRNAMHSLFMTGMFGDLPVENQLDPRMQDRLWESQAVMDEALAGVEGFLMTRTPEQLSRVRATLRERPQVLRGIIDTLDDEASRSGVSVARGAQLRTLFTEVGWRMEKQPPALIIGEYISKVQRAAATDVESEARQRWLMSRLSEETFWQAQESLRKRRISRGLKAMGIGVLLFLAGAALVALGVDDNGDGNSPLLWIGLVPGITGGSILFVTGFIILIVGAVTPADAA